MFTYNVKTLIVAAMASLMSTTAAAESPENPSDVDVGSPYSLVFDQWRFPTLTRPMRDARRIDVFKEKTLVYTCTEYRIGRKHDFSECHKIEANDEGQLVYVP